MKRMNRHLINYVLERNCCANVQFVIVKNVSSDTSKKCKSKGMVMATEEVEWVLLILEVSRNSSPKCRRKGFAIDSFERRQVWKLNTFSKETLKLYTVALNVVKACSRCQFGKG